MIPVPGIRQKTSEVFKTSEVSIRRDRDNVLGRVVKHPSSWILYDILDIQSINKAKALSPGIG